MRLRLLIVLSALIGGLTFAPHVSADSWDYIYDDNPSSVNDVSSFTGVRIDPLGGVFLTGYFYGQFEGLSSNGQWVRFVQHRNENGAVDWTRAIDTVAGSTPPSDFEWKGVDGQGTLFLRRSGYSGNYLSISQAGTINYSSAGICVGSAADNSNLIADEVSGLVCLNSVAVTQGASWHIQKLDSAFSVVWERTVSDQGDRIQIGRAHV